MIGDTVGGYAWAVLLDGALQSGNAGYAQMPNSNVPDGILWSPTTLCNLASVSKTITATAIFLLVQNEKIRSVNETVLPFIKDYLQQQIPDWQPKPGFETVTIAELLTMTARLPPNGYDEGAPLVCTGGPPAFVTWYTQHYGLAARQLYLYSNANFVILETVVDAICAADNSGYVDFVQNDIFAPMQITDMTIMQPAADQATLPYKCNDPSAATQPFETANLIGAGGWIGSASGVAKFAAGLRSGSVLKLPYVEFMQQRLMGWYQGGTTYGLCYHHNGSLATRDGCAISTGVVSFPNGYDVALLVNHAVGGSGSSQTPGIIGVMIDAFDAAS